MQSCSVSRAEELQCPPRRWKSGQKCKSTSGSRPKKCWQTIRFEPYSSQGRNDERNARQDGFWHRSRPEKTTASATQRKTKPKLPNEPVMHHRSGRTPQFRTPQRSTPKPDRCENQKSQLLYDDAATKADRVYPINVSKQLRIRPRAGYCIVSSPSDRDLTTTVPANDQQGRHCVGLHLRSRRTA